MIALLGSLLGFLASALPDVIKLFTAAADRKQELAILTLQMEAQKQGAIQRLEEINANADIQESLAVHQPQQIVGIKWVDGLVESVRPIITYGFFALYAGIKISVMLHSSLNDTPWAIWTDEDMATWAAIVSFWFGGRHFDKARNNK